MEVFLAWAVLILGFCVLASYIARRSRSSGFLIATFASLVVISNVTAVKITTIAGFAVPAAVVAYSVTFLLTDMLSEFYSKRDAHRAVWAGFYANILLVVVVGVAVLLPPAPFWEHQQAFEALFSLVPRIVLASMVAYLISQHFDVLAFHFWKQLTAGRYLWLRNNASTMVSQLIDTALFITIAFYGTGMPLGEMIMGQYVVKLAIALLDTPFMYLSRWVYRNL
ncbi:MAG: queuosine precursor transporter [Euryarchaeota archaeon]|nr:queuosine precursor transporter [Euryarchaeota archaeon]